MLLTCAKVTTSRWRRLRNGGQVARSLREESVPGPTADRVALTAALARLPETQRRAVVLYYLGDLTTREIAEQEGLRGPHLRLFEAIGRVHPQVLGRTLPLNGAGTCGAVLADLGLPLEMLRGFALLARAAGLLGQLAEEQRRPIANDIYMNVDRSAVYVPPEPE